MKLSAIYTTACGCPNAAGQFGGGGIYAKTIADREQLLRDKILPAALDQDIDEVIVVGRPTDALVEEFGKDVTFITLPPMRLDRIEAFRERELGARFSTGDILICVADDHALDPSFADTVRQIASEEWDVLTPRRVHALTGQTLNNGRSEGYSPWHCQVYKRHAWAMLPFTKFDTLWVDIVLPQEYERLGLKLTWDDRLTAYDVEANENER